MIRSALMNSSVFRSRRNEDGRWQLRSSTGREFHMDGPATAKLRGPYSGLFLWLAGRLGATTEDEVWGDNVFFLNFQYKMQGFMNAVESTSSKYSFLCFMFFTGNQSINQSI